MIDFSYGLGFGQNFSARAQRLRSFTVNGGWLFKINAFQKHYYLAKLYAGIGEYLVQQNLTTSDGLFTEQNSNIRKLCLKGGVNLGIAFRFGCGTLSASMRLGYHYGLQPEYKGFKNAEISNLKGIDICPLIGYSLNF